MKPLIKIAVWLLVLGGIVMGVEGLTDKDLVEVVFGNSLYETIVDSAMGISALIVAYTLVTKKSLS